MVKSLQTHPLSTGVDPFFGIGIRDATSDLKMARPGGQRLFCGHVVSWSQHDDMGAEEIRIAVELRKICRRIL